MRNRPFMAAWAFVTFAIASPASSATLFQSTLDDAPVATDAATSVLHRAQAEESITTGVVDFNLDRPQRPGSASDKVQRADGHRTPAASSGPVFFGPVGADSDIPAPSVLIPDAAGQSMSSGADGNAATRPPELTRPFNDRLYLNAHTPGLPRR